MTSAISRSFATQITELHEAIRSDWRWLSPEAAFAVWIARTNGQSPPVDPSPVGEGNWSEAPFLAALGYLLSSSVLPASEANRWAAGISLLSRKEPLPADRNSFLFRPIELLGVAVGIAALDNGEELKSWLCDTLRRGERLLAVDDWSLSLTAWAVRAVGSDITLAPAALKDVGSMALEILEQLPTANVDRFLATIAVDGVPSNDLGHTSSAWAALRMTVGDAVHDMRVGPPNTTATDIVELLCRRFPAYIKQLGQRHDGRATLVVNDEYDVQDALHAALRLHFADVREEEWAPSHAATSTRLDLLLKAERIVIETKMTRRGLTQKILVEEIAVDKERYKSHPDCGSIVFFVYDPDGRLKNPVALETDMSGSIGSIECRVIISPREYGAESPT